MKKLVTVFVLVIAVCTCLFCLTACNDKEDEVSVLEYVIAESTFTVGDAFSKSSVAVTAKMSDETEKTISNNLVLAEKDVEALCLNDEDKLTKAGTFAIKVYIIEENANYPEFYLGDWEITVKAKK